jgi:hypothetical protein
MRKTLLAMIGLVGVMALASGTALAAGDANSNGPEHRHHFKHRLGNIAKDLDLTAQQKAEIKTILKAAHQEVKGAKGFLGKIKIYIAAYDKIKTTVLTDAQRAKFAEMKAKWQAKHHNAAPAGKATA